MRLEARESMPLLLRPPLPAVPSRARVSHVLWLRLRAGSRGYVTAGSYYALPPPPLPPTPTLKPAKTHGRVQAPSPRTCQVQDSELEAPVPPYKLLFLWLNSQLSHRKHRRAKAT